MRIGITGHQRLRDPAAWRWVEMEINQFLGAAPRPLVGISSLAAGADQLFAKVVLQHGGALEVVIPFAAYETTFVADREREEFKRLLRRCTRSETLEERGTNEQAYFVAGKRVIDRSDLVVAVWDGGPAGGLGGTADAVKYGLQQRKIIVHLNPVTKTRRQISVGEHQA